MIRVQAIFSQSDIARAHAAELTKIHGLIISNLMYIGFEAVALARNHGNYKDDTGNLRSSVGFVIGKNGATLNSGGFEGTGTGKNTGRTFAEKLLADTNGYALAVVAGMYYGVYVEKRQYDVVTFTEASARITAKQLFESMFRQ